MRTATLAGVGVATAAFDIIDIFGTKHEVAREELIKMRGQYKEGSQERKLIQGLLDDMNYKSSDFQKFKRDNLMDMSGGDRNIYNHYRLINRGNIMQELKLSSDFDKYEVSEPTSLVLERSQRFLI